MPTRKDHVGNNLKRLIESRTLRTLESGYSSDGLAFQFLNRGGDSYRTRWIMETAPTVFAVTSLRPGHLRRAGVGFLRRFFY